jgi:predicted dehydrogenase
VSKKTYGVAVVGFGFMGKTHSYGYRTLPFYYGEDTLNYAMRGVCTRREETIAEAKALVGFDFGTTDFDEILERDDIDIVHICTPNVLHRDQLIKAIQAGKHIYCDKPLASSYEDCKAILAALDKAPRDLVTQVALQYRFYPCTMRAKQLIDAGRLGKLYGFRACYLHASNIDPNKPLKWKMDKEQGGGGVLYDLGSHVLDLVGHLVGPFSRVFAETHTATKERTHEKTGEMTKVETDDLAIMMLRTQEDALGSIEASKIATGMNDELRVEIHGEKGALRLNLMDPNWVELYEVDASGAPLGGDRGFTKIETVSRYPAPGGAFPAPALNVGWLRAHVACLYNFLAAIDGKETAQPTIHEAAEVQRVMDAAYASAEHGRWESL